MILEGFTTHLAYSIITWPWCYSEVLHFFKWIIYQCQEQLPLKPRRSPRPHFLPTQPEGVTCFSLLIKATSTHSLPWVSHPQRTGEKKAVSPVLFPGCPGKQPRVILGFIMKPPRINRQAKVFMVLKAYKGLRYIASFKKSLKIPFLSC